MNNEFHINDLVLVNNDKNDPVAAEYLNDHATILELHPPYAKVQFLNGDIYNILITNLKEIN